MGVPFPHDLPDLLRLAMGQGKMRLYTSFGAEQGHRVGLARTGDGWDNDAHRDPLEAIARVLRGRYGKMLEREREKLISADSDCLLKHHLPDGGTPYCDCGGETDDIERFDNHDITDAIFFALSRRTGLDDDAIRALAEAVIDRLYGSDRPLPDDFHQVDMTTAGALAEEDCRYCAGTKHFYGDADLGPCGCQPVEINEFEALL